MDLVTALIPVLAIIAVATVLIRNAAEKHTRRRRRRLEKAAKAGRRG